MRASSLACLTKLSANEALVYTLSSIIPRLLCLPFINSESIIPFFPCLIETASAAPCFDCGREQPLGGFWLTISSSNMDSITDSQWFRGFRGTGLPIQASVLIATIIVLTVCHRRFFSPISSIPGPFLASITRLWHLRQVSSGKQNLKLIEQHDKHGTRAPFLTDSAREQVSHLRQFYIHQKLTYYGISCVWRQTKPASTTRMLSRLCS